ncbi:hypothetical protein PR048_023789 [Dryococelus australis]|uniref:Uncharacterized protein n=1 Tax=Dryococelus australis TaxID=614101 RepID=A0ABQ9GV29_9NEOP|nr:hypothetical protein PR048_023789 [Dryococelus australis]
MLAAVLVIVAHKIVRTANRTYALSNACSVCYLCAPLLDARSCVASRMGELRAIEDERRAAEGKSATESIKQLAGWTIGLDARVKGITICGNRHMNTRARLRRFPTSEGKTRSVHPAEGTRSSSAREICTPVQSLALSGDDTVDKRSSFALIASALLGPRRVNKRKLGGILKARHRILHFPPIKLPEFVGLLLVAKRLTYSLPTKANRVQSPDGPFPDFRIRGSCRTMPLVSGFSRGSPVSPSLSLQRCSILTSFTLMASEDLAVKSRPNIFTHSSPRRKFIASVWKYATVTKVDGRIYPSSVVFSFQWPDGKRYRPRATLPYIGCVVPVHWAVEAFISNVANEHDSPRTWSSPTKPVAQIIRTTERSALGLRRQGTMLVFAWSDLGNHKCEKLAVCTFVSHLNGRDVTGADCSRLSFQWDTIVFSQFQERFTRTGIVFSQFQERFTRTGTSAYRMRTRNRSIPRKPERRSNACRFPNVRISVRNDSHGGPRSSGRLRPKNVNGVVVPLGRCTRADNVRAAPQKRTTRAWLYMYSAHVAAAPAAVYVRTCAHGLNVAPPLAGWPG